jgi:hypothetical protein
MRRLRSRTVGVSVLALAASASAPARASDLDAQGRLVFATDALGTCDFESYAEASAAGAGVLQWQKGTTSSALRSSALTISEWSLVAVPDPRALHGSHSLRIAVGTTTAVAYRDAGLFTATATTSAQVGSVPLVSTALDPVGPDTLLDPNGVAWIDAVEVDKAPGAVQSGACTLATVDADCGMAGDCWFGHCIDSAFAWGALPAAMHQDDLVQRWVFTATSLLADRSSVAKGAPAFSAAAAVVAGATPRTFFGALNEQVTALRDAHTTMGQPALSNTPVEALLNRSSGGLDACFGVVQNDLPGGDSALHYAVFATGGHSALTETVSVGDLLTAIDGGDPDAWLSSALARFALYLPNDPSADPSHRAIYLGSLVSHHASTIELSHCAPAGCAAPVTIPIGAEIFAKYTATSGIPGYSLTCTPRFLPAVASATDTGSDKVFVETQGALSKVQFDGFEPDPSTEDQAWKTPFQQALASANVLVDARYGHGGQFALGTWLASQIRGADQPVAWLALPRADADSVDAPWLLGSGWDACLLSANAPSNACYWGGHYFEASGTSTAAKIAWIDSWDVSMNDFLPRTLKGATDVRIFGPHPSFGAYGVISSLAPMAGNWTFGSIQVLDTRFGATFDDAVSQPWASGKGVAPDQVVVQKLSDLVAGQDTLVNAALTWLMP